MTVNFSKSWQWPLPVDCLLKYICFCKRKMYQIQLFWDQNYWIVLFSWWKQSTCLQVNVSPVDRRNFSFVCRLYWYGLEPKVLANKYVNISTKLLIAVHDLFWNHYIGSDKIFQIWTFGLWLHHPVFAQEFFVLVIFRKSWEFFPNYSDIWSGVGVDWVHDMCSSKYASAAQN